MIRPSHLHRVKHCAKQVREKLRRQFRSPHWMKFECDEANVMIPKETAVGTSSTARVIEVGKDVTILKISKTAKNTAVSDPVDTELLPSDPEDAYCKTCSSKRTGDTCPVCEKIFKCKICEQKFSGPNGLNLHIAQMHDDSERAEMVYICSMCKTPFTSLRDLDDHTTQSHLRSKQAKRTRGAGDNDGKVCSLCPTTFTSEARLNDHVKKTHRVEMIEEGVGKGNVAADKTDFVCPVCRKTFPHDGNHSKHMKDSHHWRRGKISQLLRHNHVFRRPCVCKICSSTYTNYTDLEKHIRKMHFKGGTARVCRGCQQICKDQKELEAHLATEHKGEGKIEDQKDKPYTCPKCAGGFAKERYLKNHMERVHKIYYERKRFRRPSDRIVRITRNNKTATALVTMSPQSATEGTATSGDNKESGNEERRNSKTARGSNSLVSNTMPPQSPTEGTTMSGDNRESRNEERRNNKTATALVTMSPQSPTKGTTTSGDNKESLKINEERRNNKTARGNNYLVSNAMPPQSPTEGTTTSGDNKESLKINQERRNNKTARGNNSLVSNTMSTEGTTTSGDNKESLKMNEERRNNKTVRRNNSLVSNTISTEGTTTSGDYTDSLKINKERRNNKTTRGNNSLVSNTMSTEGTTMSGDNKDSLKIIEERRNNKTTRGNNSLVSNTTSPQSPTVGRNQESGVTPNHHDESPVTDHNSDEVSYKQSATNNDGKTRSRRSRRRTGDYYQELLKATMDDNKRAKRIQPHRSRKTEKSFSPYEFKCQLCSLELFDMRDIDDHLNAHETRGEFDAIHVCESCGRVFDTPDGLTDHMLELHSYQISQMKKNEEKVAVTPEATGQILEAMRYQFLGSGED